MYAITMQSVNVTPIENGAVMDTVVVTKVHACLCGHTMQDSHVIQMNSVRAIVITNIAVMDFVVLFNVWVGVTLHLIALWALSIVVMDSANHILAPAMENPVVQF